MPSRRRSDTCRPEAQRSRGRPRSRTLARGTSGPEASRRRAADRPGVREEAQRRAPVRSTPTRRPPPSPTARFGIRRIAAAAPVHLHCAAVQARRLRAPGQQHGPEVPFGARFAKQDFSLDSRGGRASRGHETHRVSLASRHSSRSPGDESRRRDSRYAKRSGVHPGGHRPAAPSRTSERAIARSYRQGRPPLTRT